jgi:hypothetical protein
LERAKANKQIDRRDREGRSRQQRPDLERASKTCGARGQAGSKELRDWAGLELRGYYQTHVELPEYRKPAATIRIDGATFNGMITGQMISPSA